MTKTKNNFGKLLLALCVSLALALAVLGGFFAVNTTAKADEATPHLFLKEGGYNQGNNSIAPYTNKVLPQGWVYAIDADSDGCTYMIEIHANVCHYMFKPGLGGNSKYGNAQWFNVPLHYGVEDGESTLIAAGSDYLNTITMDFVSTDGNAEHSFVIGRDCSKGDGIAFTFGGRYASHASYESIITINGGDMGTIKAHVKCVTEFSDEYCEPLTFSGTAMNETSDTIPTKHLVELKFNGATGFDFSSESANKIASIHAADNITRNHILIGKNAVGDSPAIPASPIADIKDANDNVIQQGYNTLAGTNINVNINQGSIEFIRMDSSNANTDWQEGEYIILQKGMQLANYYGPEGAPLTAQNGKTYKILEDTKFVYNGTAWVNPKVVDGVTLSETEKTVDKRDTFTLEATVAGGGEHATTVTWASSNTDVATVADGVVTAVGPGTANITATSTADATKSASCAVTVNDVYADLAFNNPVFGEEKHNVHLYFANGVTLSDDASAWNNYQDINLGVGFDDMLANLLVNGDTPRAIKKDTFQDSQNAGLNIQWHVRDNMVWLIKSNKAGQAVAWNEGEVIEIKAGFLLAGGNGAWQRNSDGDLYQVKTTQKFILKSGVWVTPDGIATVTLSGKPTTTPEIGDTFKLDATVVGGGEHVSTVTWSTSNDGVATVDAEGNVEVVGAGEVTVTATSTADETKKDEYTFTVEVHEDKAITSVTISGKPTGEIKVDDEFTLTATVEGGADADKTVTWKTSNAEVATVDANGKVTVIAAGEVKITATAKGDASKKDEYTFTAAAKEDKTVSGVTISGKPTGEIKAGDEFTLTATVAGGADADKTVTWTTSNAAVATVDANGKVTVVAAGEVKITATSKGDASKKDEYTFTAAAKEDNKPNTGDGDKTEKPEKKGCGSSVATSAASAALVLVLAAGVALVSKKRKANN